jgi:hypothetical protein
LYRNVLIKAQDSGIPFALGGGMAAMVYAGQTRDSKDIDIYLRPGDRDGMIGLLTSLGLTDYYDQKPYDRSWIYRSWQDGMIVDVMWGMANQRAQVDDLWLSGPSFEVEGRSILVVPPEEILWSKLYVLQRDRCDWPDALNMLYALGPDLAWSHLLERVGPDVGLLAGLLATFRWLCPTRAAKLPASLWSRLGLEPCSQECGATGAKRADLLDKRPWFTPRLEGERRFTKEEDAC